MSVINQAYLKCARNRARFLFFAFSLLFLFSELSVSASGSVVSFRALGDLAGGQTTSRAADISEDGTVVVGVSHSLFGTQAFRWSTEYGLQGMYDLPGGFNDCGANAVASDGYISVGYAYGTNGSRPVQWFGIGVSDLGNFQGGSYGVAQDVSGDGTISVGQAALSDGDRVAFRRTTTTMVSLGDLSGGAYDSLAFAISKPGDVIVGYGSSQAGREAFRWRAGQGMVGLGDLSGGGFHSVATEVNYDGSIIVGYSESNLGIEGFRWSFETGMVGLGNMAGTHSNTRAIAVSGDANRIVGYGNTGTQDTAIIWEPDHGMRNLEDMLEEDYGLLFPGWSFERATAINTNGDIIAGYGINPEGNREAWVVTLPEPNTLTLVLTLSVWVLRRKQRCANNSKAL